MGQPAVVFCEAGKWRSTIPAGPQLPHVATLLYSHDLTTNVPPYVLLYTSMLLSCMLPRLPTYPTGLSGHISSHRLD